mmetsp:Transcript_25939/g.47830  ORF Transcript_25939/g.47830 Transcript_25939/m.47830 type:complete len:115 (-) Transcript_25939:2416-2760(-)
MRNLVQTLHGYAPQAELQDAVVTQRGRDCAAVRKRHSQRFSCKQRSPHAEVSHVRHAEPLCGTFAPTGLKGLLSNDLLQLNDDVGQSEGLSLAGGSPSARREEGSGCSSLGPPA